MSLLSTEKRKHHLPPANGPDPIQELADAKTILQNLQQEDQRLGQQIRAWEKHLNGRMAPTAAEAEQAAAVDVAIADAGGPVAMPPASNDLYRRSRAIKAAIERQIVEITRLTPETAAAIYSRDFEQQHLEARRKLAAAIVAAKVAFDGELALAVRMNAAGALPRISDRLWLNLSNSPQIRSALQGTNLRAFQQANSNLLK
jgi:hypothetical protein